MDLRMTVLQPRATGATVDVLVSAEPGTPVREVTPGLLAAAGAPPGLVLWHDGRPLDPAAPLGLPPLLQGAVLLAAAAGQARPGAEPPVAELHVIAGPDAGSVLAVRPGRTVVGRGHAAGLRVADPDASREHLELLAGTDRVTARDLLSANGSSLGERPLPADRAVTVPVGGRLRIGSTELELQPPAGPSTACRPDGLGHLLVNRAPLPGARPEPETIGFPEPPAAPAGTAPPSWATLLVPLLLAVPAALLWHQPVLLVLALGGPVAMGVQHLVDRFRQRRSARRAGADHARSVAVAADRLAAALEQDLGRLHREHPPPSGITAIAAGPTVRLWERGRGDPLQVRLGVGPVPPRVAVTGGSAPAVPPHREAPVLLDLGRHRMVGLCGDRATVLGLARSMLGQLAVLHAPDDLQLDEAGHRDGPAPEWAWLRRLPHYRPAGSGPALPERTGETPARVLVLDATCGQVPSPVGADRQGADTGSDARPLLLCLAAERSHLPRDCSAVLVCGPQTGELLGDGEPVTFRPEPGPLRWASQLARRLAPLRVAAAAAEDGLPAAVGWVPLLRSAGVDPTDPDDVLRRWGTRTGPVATVGVHAHGRFDLDLVRDGPHALVAGTTGAGKSELLLTWVAALATAAPPDRLAFLLVDYKGGAAFSAVLGLPHVAALLTDLDQHRAGRALAGLQAEVRRRERQLRRFGCADLDGYELGRWTSADRPALPRLVVLVDEFRVLADEVPGFVPGLVRIAAVGRSLGIHLVLATQRPGGAVGADLRANVNLRVALRVRDRAESQDVVDSPLAAGLDPSAAGRAVARAGPAAPVVFQAARVRGVHRSGGRAVVQVLTPAGPGALPLPPGPADAGAGPDAGRTTPVEPDDLDRVVSAVQEAARRCGAARAEPPWLPPLPDVLPYPARAALGPVGTRPGRGDVPDQAGAEACGCPGPGLGQGGLPVLLGRVDHPSLPAQHDWHWPAEAGNLAVAGGPGSGRSTAVRTLAAAYPGPVYVLDGSGALADLAALPTVAAVVPALDVERTERLLDRLGALVRQRSAAARTCGSVTGGTPPVLLAVDGWEQVTQAWSADQHGAAVDRLLALLRDGPAAGLVAAVTGGRAVLTGPPSGCLGQRLLLPMADPAEEVMAGLPSSWQGRRRTPGRAVLLGAAGIGPEGAEVQLALPPDLGTPATAAGAGTGPGADPVPVPAAFPFLVPELPVRVSRRAIAGGAGTAGLLVGLGGPDVTPLSLPLAPGTGALVAGSPGSGRSTALASLAQAIEEAGGVALLLDAWDPEAAARVRARPQACVLVDGPLPLPPDLDDALHGHLAAGRTGTPRHGGCVLLACEPGQVVQAYAGVLTELRVHRTGLLLGSLGPGEGEGFGLRLAPRPAGPPGRGLLVVRGRAVTVQVAVPDAGPLSPGLPGPGR